MKFFRNPEIKKMLWLMVLISLLFIVPAFLYLPVYGMVTLLFGVLLAVTFLVFTNLRYKRIAELGNEIDHVLHNEKKQSIAGFNEGELSILQDEITKLVIALREQTDKAKKEKQYLADSLADISHQLRTPLTSIHLLTSFLSEPDLEDERRCQLTAELNQLLGRMEWQVNTLLKLSELDAGTVRLKEEPVNVGKLIGLVRESLDIPMELKNQQMVLEIMEDAVYTGDMDWSAECIGNILKNCMEHTQEGGVITVTSKSNPLFTEIIIRDNGSGIAPEDLPHLFERFYKGKNASAYSIGIGLALARRIVLEQNGTIKAENSRDGGAVFTIHFYQSTV